MLPLLNEFRDKLLQDGRQLNTIEGRLRACVFFWKWYGSDNVQKVTRKDISRYKIFLMTEYTPQIGRSVGKRLCGETITFRLSAVSNYFKFLHANKKIFFDPTIGLKFPEKVLRYPTYIPTEQDIQELINKPDTYTYVGIRDRLVFELSYTCPLRNIELRRLKVSDIDMKERFIYPSRAKGGYECGIPIAPSTYQVLEKYMVIARPRLLKLAKRPVEELFVTKFGGPFTETIINEIFEKYRGDKHIHPHAMRHACAVHMLRNGARLREVQLFLGHRSITSTQTYTMLTANDLKDLHSAYHPREKFIPANKKPQTNDSPKTDSEYNTKFVRPVMCDRKHHWENIYKTKRADAVSWYKPHLDKSLELLSALNLPKEVQIIDVGAGASTLPDDLLSQGFKNVTVLDVSGEALQISKGRLGDKAKTIQWIEADIANAKLPKGRFDVWHDRAAFHFLTTPVDRLGYVTRLKRSIKRGGFALIATFGPNGPLKCSGLDIVRYSPETLLKETGPTFKLKKHFLEVHNTPFGTTQEFLYCLLHRIR